MILTPSAPGAEGSALRTRRCARHPQREAVARCPSCRGFFCRECVVEHDGQLICSACLARKTASGSAPRRASTLAASRQAATLLCALFMLWLVFYELGVVLLRIPPDVHDGTLWKRLRESIPGEDGDGPQN